jgi:hypothetical protein
MKRTFNEILEYTALFMLSFGLIISIFGILSIFGL